MGCRSGRTPKHPERVGVVLAMVDINTQLPLALRQNKPKKKTTQLPTQIKEMYCLLLVVLVLTQIMGSSLSCSILLGMKQRINDRKGSPSLSNELVSKSQESAIGNPVHNPIGKALCAFGETFIRPAASSVSQSNLAC